MGSIGIPIKLLHESQGHVVTLELNNGQTYRGKLFEAEDNMNVQLKDITVTARDGRVSHLDQVYIRGSHKCANVQIKSSTWTWYRTGKRKGDGGKGKRWKGTVIELLKEKGTRVGVGVEEN